MSSWREPMPTSQNPPLTTLRSGATSYILSWNSTEEQTPSSKNGWTVISKELLSQVSPIQCRLDVRTGELLCEIGSPPRSCRVTITPTQTTWLKSTSIVGYSASIPNRQTLKLFMSAWMASRSSLSSMEERHREVVKSQSSIGQTRG